MAKTRKAEIGDFVAIHWDDASSPGRTFEADGKIPMAQLISYGVLSHVDARKVVIRNEVDVSEDAKDVPGGHGMKEVVLIPRGCVTRVVVYKAAGDASL